MRKKVKIMGKLNLISQKLKGKGQQFKGRIEVATGHSMRGNIDKLKGKTNEIAADIKMKI